MKHLLIDCENIEIDFPNLLWEKDQHLWFFLSEDSELNIPVVVVKKIFNNPENISIIRFPNIENSHFLYFLSFYLGKISIEDPEADFLLLTSRSIFTQGEPLFQSFNLTIVGEFLQEKQNMIEKKENSLPLPTKYPNKLPDPINHQNPIATHIFKLIAYDLFYRKYYFPLFLHNLEKKIKRYIEHYFQNTYFKENCDIVTEQVIQLFSKKEYIFISAEKKVYYQLSAEEIYKNISNRIYQNRPNHYYQVMKMIGLEMDFLKLPWNRLVLLFNRLVQNRVFIKIDDFIIYPDQPTDRKYLQEVAYKVALNILANPQTKPKTSLELYEQLEVFAQFDVNPEKIIEKLTQVEIIKIKNQWIIYNPKYQEELEENFPKVLYFLCKFSHHTQPRYRETLVNYIGSMFEDKKLEVFTIYLLYYRLIAEKYIVDEGQGIYYYLPLLENWN